MAAAAIFSSGEASAQVAPITNASLTTLQNDLVNGGGYIKLAFNGTIVTTTPLEIFFNTTLDASGFGVSISGNNSTPIFIVDPGVNFTVTNLIISGANNTGVNGTNGVNGTSGPNIGTAGSPGSSGSNSLGGAIYNEGNCILVNCLLASNTVTGGSGGAGGTGGNGSFSAGNGGSGGSGGAAYGAGVYNLGTLVLSNCTVAGNIVTGGDGGGGGTNGTGSISYPGAGGLGALAAGAGIYNLGIATIINSTFNQNYAQGGNTQTAGGNPQGNSNGQNGNSGGTAEGSGIFNLGTNTIVNCTFFANVATGGAAGNGGQSGPNGHGGNGGNGGSAYGAGVCTATGGLLSLTNCTFSGDAADGGTPGVVGAGNFSGGVNGVTGATFGANIANNGGTLQLKNSILASPTNAANAFGTITDLGNNISSDGTPTFTTTNSFINLNPKLSPTGLSPNSSSTVLTIALSPNSPAIDKVFDASAPPYDERGFPRPAGLRSDIGAFEFGAFTTNFNVSGQVTIGGKAFPGVAVNAGIYPAVTDSNGNFSFSLPVSNSYTIFPTPQAYFSPNATSVFVTGDMSGLLFNATNAAGSVIRSGSTNTNSLQFTFTGIPNFKYRLQGATNLATNPVVWLDIATNTSGSTGAVAFSYVFGGTNLTNFPQHFFRAVTP